MMQRKEFPLATGNLSYLYWESSLPDAPILHFAHANGMNAQTYQQLLASLSSHFHVYAIDFRGHGFSTLPANPQQLQNWNVFQQDLFTFLQRFQQPVYLAGHSFGGVVSLLLTKTYPELVKALVLYDPVILPIHLSLGWALIKFFHQTHHLGLVKKAKKRRSVWASVEAIKSAYQGKGMFQTWSETWIEDYLQGGLRTLADQQVQLSCDPHWEAQIFATLPTRTWFALSKIKCPLSVVYGANSNTFFDPAPTQLQRRCPHAKLVAIAGGSHFIPMESPEILRKETLSVLHNTVLL